jgi:phage tail-like protein
MSDYSAQSVNPMEWPLAKFSFRVTIDGLPELGFQTVEGLESEISVAEYRMGNSDFLFKAKRPMLASFSNVTFKKGEFAGDANLKDWWHMYAWEHQTNRNERKEILIEMMDEAQEVMITWTLYGAFPVKFTPSNLDAEADSEIAFEEMEVAIESFVMEKMA